MPELGGVLYGAGMGIVNNSLGILNGHISRKENYKYGEMAANNADARTRALYNDLYSIPAQMQQIKDAGLSPSLFYGQAGGISGQSGSQGTGASGVQNPTYGIDPLTMAQIKNINADTQNKEADTNKKNVEIDITNIQKSIEEMNKNLQTIDFALATNKVIMSDNSETSAYEIALQKNNYREFVNEMKNAAENNNFIKDALNTQRGQDTLKKIYYNAKEFQTELAQLNEQKLNANFGANVMQIINNAENQNLKADTVIQELKTTKAIGELTEQQKDAWLKLIDGMKNEDAKTLFIVLGMFINNAMSNWH